LRELHEMLERALSANEFLPLEMSGDSEIDGVARQINELGRKINGTEHSSNHTIDYVALLSNLGRSITSEVNASIIYRNILNALTGIMNVSGLWISMYDGNNGNYKYYANENSSEPLNTSPFQKDADPMKWCTDNKKELLLDNAAKDYGHYFGAPVIAPDGNTLNAIICYPLLSKGLSIGAVCIAGAHEGAFSKQQKEVVYALAPFISLAMENAKIYTELQAAQLQLVQSDKMASLGQLTAGIAHEINNPVNFISAGIDALKQNYQDIKEILLEYLSLDAEKNNTEKIKEIRLKQKQFDLDGILEEIAQLYTSIKNGAQRTTEIVKGLRNFSRLDEDVLKKANIEECLDSTLIILRSQIKERIEVIKEYGHVPEILCFPGQLNQVFINILNNAAQAIEGQGKIWIKTRADSDYIEIRIKDSGKGIPQDVKNKIFDPFFTTKDVGVGTGLGLSISNGIIEKHKGKISVESVLGEGAEFIILIPVNLSEE